jgi:CHAT domain-containing protein/tetratricopeptide (TPR) repeat protein
MFHRRAVSLWMLTAATALAIASNRAFCQASQQPAPTKEAPASSGQGSPSSTIQEPVPNWASSPYADEITAAWGLYNSGKVDDAENAFRKILQEAKSTKDERAEAQAHTGLGAVYLRLAKFAAARAEYELALALCDSLHDGLGKAAAHLGLGNAALELDNKSARVFYTQALTEFSALGAEKEKIQVLLNLALVTDSYPERIKLDAQALETARQFGDKRRQGEALHAIGQWLFHEGDSKTAQEKYKEAEALLDSPENHIYLGRVLLSEGRLQRADGAMDQAIEILGRALKMAEDASDKQGRIQILTAIAASYGDQGKYREALTMFQSAFDLAKETNLLRSSELLRQNIAECYIDLHEDRRGAEMLEEANRQSPDPFPYGAQFRYATLALAYKHLGEYDRAVAAATKSIEEAKARKNEQFVSEPLTLRALAEEKLAKYDAALADVRAALETIEGLRARLVPSDFMKRGFAEKTQENFDFSVQLLQEMNQPAQAIEIAEQARSRAFLDLLATRQGKNGKSSGEGLLAEKKPAPPLPPGGVASAQAQASADGTQQLTQRGGKTSTPPSATIPADPELPSMVSAETASLKEMQEQARRLHSTILSYWVGSESTFVWVLDSKDAVHSARIPLKREHLVELVRGVWPIDGHSEPVTKSETAEAISHKPISEQHAAVEFPSRGQAQLKADRTQKDRWRELYQLLIEPIETYLPTQLGARITIIPHGPLFALPFAGLRDAHDRYFLERFTLQYAPAISVLRFTGANAAHAEGAVPHFLLVADPAGMQKLGLPQLPGSRREVSDVARRFPANEVTVLTGADAQADSVRSAAAKSTIIHFATHGIVDDTQPFDSYLALADGKLTARDIYGLNLNADLVFLSACRSGMGKVTGDGVLGLTRAFLYAGTRSVVATLWDVADEPTAKLVASFYKNVSQNPDKAQALRSAQLSVLRQLRAGKLQVATRRGPLTLPENPIFWASFVLIGEP